MTRSIALLLATSALVPAISPTVATAQTLPSGGTVVRGEATIATPSSTTVAINQTSDRAIINWQNFSVGAGNSVQIIQPDAQSVLLNRVTGDLSSTISGAISANGQMFLINPNGIQITSTGSVNAAGFVASTLDIDNDRFMAGDIVVKARGTAGAISNAGQISIVRGGYAALIGGAVNNSGFIYAPLGRVALATGDQATLDLAGDGFLQVAIPTAQSGGITMAGRISADGGSVILSAASARDAARQTVNLSGVIEARGVEGRSGSVTLTGDDIRLTGATIDASGPSQGGQIRIGGDRQGNGPLTRALTLSVDADSYIRADATGAAGVGGDIVLWSDEATHFAGSISGRGAQRGGEVEVSSRGILSYTGVTDLSGGRFGNLLLDPYNITISDAPNSNMTLFNGSSLIATDSNRDSVLNVTTLTNNLALANMTVMTGTAGAQDGDITVAAPINWSANTVLTLKAAGNIAINANITATGTDAGLALVHGADKNYTISGGRVTLSGANSSFSVNGDAYTLIRNVDDLQAMQGDLAGHYALASDIDASGTESWNQGAGFAPVGTNIARFSGTLAGLGHVVSGLTINRSKQSSVGLFGYSSSSAMVRDLGLVGGKITGDQNVGSLLGVNLGTVQNAYATGHVEGSISVGGLVGYQYHSTVQDAYTTGHVSGYSLVGGIVGQNSYGTVQNAYATGHVSGDAHVGGIIGFSANGTVRNAYASAQVSGTRDTGGLIGYNFEGLLHNAYWDSYSTTQTNGIGSNWYGNVANVSAVTSDPTQVGATNYAFNANAYGNLDPDLWFFTDGVRPLLRSEWSTNITNAHQLQLMALQTAAHYTLAWDIDASATAAAVYLTDTSAPGSYSGIWGPKGFSPVGSPSGHFSGSLTGLGHVVSGLTINRPTQDYVGLFGVLGATATVRDLGLVGGQVTGNQYVGGILGYNNPGGVVQDIYSTGQVTGSALVGGLVGGNFGTVQNAHATASVTGTLSIGGLVGINYGTVNNAYATGQVAGTENSINVGGLVGYNGSHAIVQNVYASGLTSGNNYVGGVVGYNDNAILVVNAYWDSYSTQQSNGIGFSSVGSAAITFAVTSNPNELSASNYAFNAAAYAHLGPEQWFFTDGVRPLLRSEWSTNITNAHQLQLMAMDPSAHYTLARDIDASATAAAAFLANDAAPGSYSGIWGPKGFSPVGTTDFTGDRFTGTLTGLGHVVSGLTINRPEQSYVGLFGGTGSSAIVRDLGLVGGQITGKNHVGGLVGDNNGTVQNAYATGQVSGTGFGIGGLLGDNGGTVQNAYATGQVSGNDEVGGLVGYNDYDAIVQNAYATGQVSGNTGVGGLVGINDGGTVQNAYATGQVLGQPSSSAGVVGSNIEGTVQDVYWDSYSTHQSLGIGESYDGNETRISAVTSDPTKSAATNYAFKSSAWDAFSANSVSDIDVVGGQDKVWRMYEGSTLPMLKAFMTGATVNVAGESTATYTGQMQSGSATYTLSSNTMSELVQGTFRGGTNIGVNAGTYAIGIDGLYSGQQGYDLILGSAGQFTITQKDLIVTAHAQNRIYGDANPELTYTTSGLVMGDTLTGALATDATLASGVGSYDITQGTLANNNYALTIAPNTLTITPRSLTVTATGLTRDYDGSVFSGGNGVRYDGFVNGETEAALGGTLSFSGTSQDAKNVGNYQITAAGLSSDNYDINFVDGRLAIEKADLTVTVDAQNRMYGDANPALTYTTSGLVIGDTLTGALATNATLTSGVGRYAITQGTLANNNYALTIAINTLAITPRPLTVTATGLTRDYDGSVFSGGNGARYDGFVNGETANVLGGTLSFGGTSQGAKNAGNYQITAGGLSSNNYTINFVDGLLAIEKADLTVAVDAQSRIYGDANPALSYTTSGLVMGDTLTGALSTDATLASGVGHYDITQGTLANNNYALTIAPNTLTITPRSLTVTATGLTQDYDGSVFSGGNGVHYDGFVHGETEAVLGGTLSFGGTSQGAKNVGNYQIAAAGLTSDNYAINFVDGLLAIEKRDLTVTIDALSRIYGDANPALTYTSLGLLNGDTLTGTLSTEATSTSEVGRYEITQGTLANGNYALTIIPNSLTIDPRALTVTADNLQRPLGAINPTLTYHVGGMGLANGDTLTGGLSTTATQESASGHYAIDQGNLAASANYTLTYVGGSLAISRPAPTASEDRGSSLTRDAFNALLAFGKPTDNTAHPLGALTGTDATDSAASGSTLLPSGCVHRRICSPHVTQ